MTVRIVITVIRIAWKNRERKWNEHIDSDSKSKGNSNNINMGKVTVTEITRVKVMVMITTIAKVIVISATIIKVIVRVIVMEKNECNFSLPASYEISNNHSKIKRNIDNSDKK